MYKSALFSKKGIFLKTFSSNRVNYMAVSEERGVDFRVMVKKIDPGGRFKRPQKLHNGDRVPYTVVGPRYEESNHAPLKRFLTHVILAQ